jgi:hypothetical protein
VHLLPCHRPTGSLEPAPRTSLRADSAHGQWEGYWSVANEAYYTRCVRADGGEQWYRVADDDSREQLAEARVIPLRRVHGRMLLVPASKDRRLMLVGTLRRRSRAAREVAR